MPSKPNNQNMRLKMDIREATRGLKRKGSGFITVKQNGGKEHKFTSVDLHDFGNDQGGLMVGGDYETKHTIGFGYPARSTDGSHKAHYKKDFCDPYLTWSYSDREGVTHVADKGELNVTFSNYLNAAKGSYSFETKEGTKFEGTFDLKAG
jgi:hypothetical protein